ncbi:hypothetical protein HPB51_013914 [Rhipicephalus microplus]|uniref:PCI domain-containing protein n=1 Tax=Rhipicephalus microplus TaxID=6941 RepID=A0A9J6DGK4_RHIMP|nr:hypothetical protein HPB51_013914 [Rhipicephalus microplus]
MPLENLEEESLEKNPNLELAQIKFVLAHHEPGNDKLKQDLMSAITEHNMAPFYEETCAELGWPVDQRFLNNMKTANATEIEKLDSAIEDAEKNLSEMEVREAHLAKAEYLSRIGDKEAALTQLRKTYDKTVSLGHRLDLLFHLIRLGLFYLDHDLITRNIDKAKRQALLIEEGGDWDRRNRLKVYQGLYSLAVRDFKAAAASFLDTVSTFTCYELMDYQRFVTYTVLVSIIALPRVELREKVSPAGGQQLRAAAALASKLQMPQSSARQFLASRSLVKPGATVAWLDSGKSCAVDLRCAVGGVEGVEEERLFGLVAHVEQLLQRDRLWAPHVRFYVREMRILAYSQLLESYRSLTLQYMANAFGVTVAFIDQELARYIAAGRLHCKIDKVGEVVETNRPDSKNYQYQVRLICLASPCTLELARYIAAGRLHCKIDKVGEVVETNRPDSKNYQYQPFKGRVRLGYQEWMSGDNPKTPTGRIQRPPLATVCGWVLSAGDSLPDFMVKKAFKKCRISNSLDG